MADFVSNSVLPGWLTKVQVGQGEQRCTLTRLWTTRLPQSVHNYPTEVIYSTKWLAYQPCWCVHANQPWCSQQWTMCASECCGRSRGNQQTTTGQHGQDVSKGQKSSQRGRTWGEARGRQTDGEGFTKVADWHVFKPVFIQEVLGDKGGYSDT